MAYQCVVTGATGYVASELTKQLLERGYNVKGTVRSLKSREKIQHLINLGDALPGRLTLHEADLLSEGSFTGIVQGADFVFHTASPFFIRGIEDPQTELVDPAVKGTRNVLKAAIKSKHTVRRVVLTSSMAAIVKVKKGPSNASLYTEEDWNDESSLTNSPYMYSKTEAEKAAWALAKEAGLDLVVINPSLVLGPVLTNRADSTSIQLMKASGVSHLKAQVHVGESKVHTCCAVPACCARFGRHWASTKSPCLWVIENIKRIFVRRDLSEEVARWERHYLNPGWHHQKTWKLLLAALQAADTPSNQHQSPVTWL